MNVSAAPGLAPSDWRLEIPRPGGVQGLTTLSGGSPALHRKLTEADGALHTAPAPCPTAHPVLQELVMPSIGPAELAIVLVIALLILGPKRLPEAGRGLGRGLREFKDSVRGVAEKDELPAASATQD